MRNAVLWCSLISIALLAAESPAMAEGEAESPRPAWTEESGRGVALGYENGLWGSLFVQGLRVRVPFGASWGLVGKGLFLHQTTGEYRGDAGGRLDLYGSSPVLLNFVRLYGGGGPYVMHVVTGAGSKEVQIGGGGHFGFEFFMKPSFSWVLEVGGGSGVDGRGGGGTAVAGFQWYPGT